MKKISIYLAALAVGAGLASCDKFLDVPPTSEITIASTLSDYKSLLHPIEMSMAGVPPELAVMGDDVYWTPKLYLESAHNEFSRRAYMWEPEVFDATTLPEESWMLLYKLVYVYNKIIDEVMDVEGEDAGALEAVQAEARVYRAYAYFILAQMWGKPYQMAAENDLCVPLLLRNDADNGSTGPQATVRAVYAAILDDLDKAIASPNLPVLPYQSSKMIGGRLAAQALKAKVLFFMGDYDKALPELNKTLKMIADNPSTDPLISYRMGNPLAGDVSLAVASYMDVEAIYANVNIGCDPSGSAMSGIVAGANCIYVSDHALAMHEKEMMPVEIMPGYFMEVEMDGLRVQTYATQLGSPKFYPDETYKTGKFRIMGYGNMGVSMPELYLMLAECNVRAAGGSLDAAVQHLETVRMNRRMFYKPLGALTADQALKLILKERMCEFVATGTRWLDMRRLWDDPVGGAMINKTRTLGDRTATLTRERLTLRIPQYVMNYNPEWIQNQ
jgi:tetratricopeptide (TPR) repeat protein